MYRSRLFTTVAFAGVLAFGTAAATQCSPGGSVSPPPTTPTTSTSTTSTTTTTTAVPPAIGDPNIAVGDVTVYEGDSGPAVVTVPVDLSTTSTSTVTVNYTIVGDPAGAGGVPTTAGTVTFAAGVVEKTISITVTGNTAVQGDGDVQVELSSPSHAQIEGGPGAVRVRDDDGTATANALSIGDATVIEADSGTRHAYVPLTLATAPPAGTTVKVTVLNSCDDAAPAADAATSGTITFRAGDRVKMLKYAVAGDTTPERKQASLK